MSIKVTFKDGSVTEYPEGVVVSDSPDGTLKFVNDSSGQVIATLNANEVASAENGA